MNIKQLETNLKSVKKYSPEVYKETMKLSVPFFILHKKLYDKGNELLANDFSLSQSELDILAALYYMTDESFTMTPTQLYDVMLFSSGGMTKFLKKLESKDYINRLDNTDDKRSKLVEITLLGKQVTANALKDIVAFENEYFSKLDKKEQEVFSQLLHKMLN